MIIERVLTLNDLQNIYLKNNSIENITQNTVIVGQSLNASLIKRPIIDLYQNSKLGSFETTWNMSKIASPFLYFMGIDFKEIKAIEIGGLINCNVGLITNCRVSTLSESKIERARNTLIETMMNSVIRKSDFTTVKISDNLSSLNGNIISNYDL